MTSNDDLQAWLPNDSAADVKILPLVRKADALCCNSYIISAPAALLVIDPGAHEEQTERIRHVLSQELAAGKRPVFFLLTHCHHDHSRSLEFWRRQRKFPVRFLAQKEGADAIESGDSELTLAFIFSQNFPSICIDYPLSFTDSAPLTIAKNIVLSGATNPEKGLYLQRRVLRLDDSLALELYHTPGHSPDSLCLRLGSMLFIGDILLAGKPGVAGIPGWSQPQLLESLRFLEQLLATGSIQTCCPGHGALLGAQDVLGMLQGAFKSAQCLSRLVRLDDRRLDLLKNCAVALAREAALQLAVLGGRLHLAAHQLDELEEEQLAQELVRAIDLDAMETFLVQFHDFSTSHDKDSFRPGIPLRGVAMVAQIGKLLAKTSLPKGIANFALRRIELLLRDYINIVCGLDLRDFLAPCDASLLLQSALDSFTAPQASEAELDAAADSPDLFGLYLARRLYRLPEVSNFSVRAAGSDLPQVLTEPERLAQLFCDCIEQFACSAGAAEISISRDDAFLAVRLSSQSGAAALNSGKALYYHSMMELLGGSFTHQLTDSAEEACFRIPIC